MSIANACGACRNAEPPFPITMAFQPIIRDSTRSVFAYEALVRGPQGESEQHVLAQVNEHNIYAFDQSCRVAAIELAARVRTEPAASGPYLSINFIPGAVYAPASCIRKTMETADRVGWPLNKIIFEFTESEPIVDHDHLRGIFLEYRRHGLMTAIDDFGSGFAGLGLLCDLQPEILKIDMSILRNIDQRPISRKITQAIVGLGESIGMQVVAEGIETVAEWTVLREMGIDLFQGYLFAKPGLEHFPVPVFPEMASQSKMTVLLP